MYQPICTYRIQLHKAFTFGQLQAIIPYLHKLGIATIYASPITAAVEGSIHGYDVTNPLLLNPEIGTYPELEAIAEQLKQYDMGWLQDIVPNHMAYDMGNPWLYDVFEKGAASPYAGFFDIDWEHPDPSLHRKIIAPFLGKDLAECIAQKEIRLQWHQGSFYIGYMDTRYPVTITCYVWLYAIAATTDEEAIVQFVNEQPGLLDELLQLQAYALTSWQVSDRLINYRRFFAINSLISLRAEDAKVYHTWHTWLLSLYHKGLVQGFRIDHIDGLADPGGYINNLRQSAGNDCYIVAEKILGEQEELVKEWPLQGTTGYDFLSQVNQLLCDNEGKEALVRFYKDLYPGLPPFEEIVFDKKYTFLKEYMAGELDNLFRLLTTLSLLPGEELDATAVKEALAVLLAAFPVYRIYIVQLPLPESSSMVVNLAFNRALNRRQDLSVAFRFLQSLFEPGEDAQQHEQRLVFLKRFMQYTSPLAAKGTEDTAFYFYNPIVSQNEVGDSPVRAVVSIPAFHNAMVKRQQALPLSMNATATHDTKRGEDARMRLNTLTTMPDEWMKQVGAWHQLNEPFINKQHNRHTPSFNDEYFIYQSLLAGWPEDGTCNDAFKERFHHYITKALREGKTTTSWSAPNEDYEQGCHQFIDAILNNDHLFIEHFQRFAAPVISAAMVYSLTQLLIKLTAPGIPDIYQGCELWDLSYVDPDNRRPVDYAYRAALLDELIAKDKAQDTGLFSFMEQHQATGIQKLFILYKTLAWRKQHPEVFADGQYHSFLHQEGGGLITYLRIHNNKKAMIIAPIPVKASDAQAGYASAITHEVIQGEWQNEFTGERYVVGDSLSLAGVLTKFPVALLTSLPPSPKGEL